MILCVLCFVLCDQGIIVLSKGFETHNSNKCYIDRRSCFLWSLATHQHQHCNPILHDIDWSSGLLFLDIPHQYRYPASPSHRLVMGWLVVVTSNRCISLTDIVIPPTQTFSSKLPSHRLVMRPSVGVNRWQISLFHPRLQIWIKLSFNYAILLSPSI